MIMNHTEKKTGNNAIPTAVQTHMQSETRIDTHIKINPSIAGNVTKYNNLHTQESFGKKMLTLPNFA